MVRLGRYFVRRPGETITTYGPYLHRFVVFRRTSPGCIMKL